MSKLFDILENQGVNVVSINVINMIYTRILNIYICVCVCFVLWLSIQSAGDLVSQTSVVRVHSAEEDSMSPFDSKSLPSDRVISETNNKFIFHIGSLVDKQYRNISKSTPSLPYTHTHKRYFYMCVPIQSICGRIHVWTLQSVGWNYLSLPKFQLCNRWSCGIDK